MPPAAPAPSPSRQAAALLVRGPFARYMLGEGISMTGTWMQLMAQSWVMTTLTNSAMMLGMVNFAAGIPMIALSMLGGSAADRGDKRNILLVTQVIQIAFALLVGRLVATGQIQIWHLLAVAFLLGISNAFEMPAASALVPELVTKEQVATAIAVDRAVFHGTRLIGPALAGFVTGSVGLLAVRRHTRRPLMIGAVFGICVALTGMSAARQFAFAAPCLILLSLCASTIIGLANTVVQERAPGSLRGRVSAIAGLSFVGLLPFAGLGITSVADWLGLRTALVISAGAYFVGALFVLRRAGAAVGEEPPAG